MAVNLALMKPTKVSSISFDTRCGSMKAVDGNRESKMLSGSCAATRMQKNSWWQVDLEAVYYITDVVITNRADNYGELERGC